ncbi:dienelactone hydrolase family protein [Dechloromonas denitrificans]|uniref:dienelactone hydrolase family protein n=1 Tax=Dechloromonas denitrificans TaxID=281362 RepID=UPI001CF84029|nr:dienelactone hydrolase family protein [Dechloromonas denitrificans]UCV04256.1 dienelactone hydrolase family protein [Dechloromonas denitrificans]
MADRREKDDWSVLGSDLMPFVDRRSGRDRRKEADERAGGVSPWAEKRHGDRRCLASTALLCISALFVAPTQATEKVSFEASNAYTADSVKLRADISKPEGNGPFPAVVLMHGCGGWQPAVRHAMRAYAEYLVEHGFVVLDLDSFGPRNIGGGKVCESIRSQRDALDYRTSDAYDALKYLRSQDYVDGKNIFLMGQSNGGSVAINVAKGDAPRDAQAADGGYRAVAAYYPWCGSFGGRKVELESPLMVFAGTDDDWTPASECEGVKSTKADLQLKTYPGAAHSFDLNIMPQKYLGKSLGHNKEAAEDSRQRMLAFFIEHTIGTDVDWKMTRLAKSGTPTQEPR